MNLAATTTVKDAAVRVWGVVVVGAGPAGAVAAREFVRRGVATLLVDKATFPRWKVCGCCLNQSALHTLARLELGHVAVGCGAVPLSRVQLAAGGRRAGVRLPGGVAISREAFDAALVREAIAKGAEYLPGTSARLGPVENDFRSVDLTAGEENARIRTKVVIAADGLNGQFTASAGNRATIDPASRIGAGAIADAAPAFYEPGTIYMAVGRGGYVGLVRVEGGKLDVAAAFDPVFVRAAGGLGAAGAEIVAVAGLPVIPGLAGLAWRGTPALTRTARDVAGERWFAVGDAAGYVEPFTGEGMAWAVASAAAVAPVAARGVVEWTDALAGEWDATHARLVRSRQTVCRVVARVLRSPRLSGWAVRALSVAPVLSRPVVRLLNQPARIPIRVPGAVS
ncbi:NAD(P)/FAD-dependent oxidoreductase [Fimbriiglobus ruber]|uniref:NAD(P)/FAD-dependent oxidoreductase n=1 Tax=Fimbriiglobus ruber TaxID=1908690 RepID=UPI00137A7AA3|nr:FAD-dependent monooxygenase [Fimbriiglobus ruber]